MADTTGMADIRGLDIDRVAKGYADRSYIFRKDCTISKMSGDSVRWFQKTAGTLAVTAPGVITNVARGSTPETLEVSWTRNTSYVRKFFVEGFIDLEDVKFAELSVLATTIKDLTLAITSVVDAHIWDVMTESQTPSLIQTFATTAVGGDQWDAASYAADIVKDLMNAKRLIWAQDYEAEGASLYVSPKDYSSIVNWLISGKGSSIPGFSSEKIKNGQVMELLGLRIKVSNNVTADYAAVVVPKIATTYREGTAITARADEETGIGTRIRVWAHGIAYNTDPKAIVLITDTQT